MSKNVAIRLEDDEYDMLLSLVGRERGAIQNGLLSIIRRESAAKRGASEEELAEALRAVVSLWQSGGDGWRQLQRLIRAGSVQREERGAQTTRNRADAATAAHHPKRATGT